jgi:hypothetical protein
LSDAQQGALQSVRPIEHHTGHANMHQWLIEIGPHTLEVETDTVPDFDSEFTARCIDTGEILTIYGWLISSCEPLDVLGTLQTDTGEAVTVRLLPDGTLAI